VVARDSVVKVEIKTCQQDTFMTLDGQQSFMLNCADRLEITCSSHQTSLVRLSGKNFFEVLAKKIMDQNR
jgi:NAD kinase